MAYGVDPKPFQVLRDRLAGLPERRPQVPSELEAALFEFIDAFDCLLRLMSAILRRCVDQAGERRAYRANLLPLLDTARQTSVSMLEVEIREGIHAELGELVEMIYALRDALLVEEAIALEAGIAVEERRRESRRTPTEEKHDDDDDDDESASGDE